MRGIRSDWIQGETLSYWSLVNRWRSNYLKVTAISNKLLLFESLLNDSF